MTKSIREFFRTLKVVLTLLCGFFDKYFKSFAEEINSWGELIRKGEIYYKKRKIFHTLVYLEIIFLLVKFL